MRLNKVVLFSSILLINSSLADVLPHSSRTLYEKAWGFYIDTLYSKTTSLYNVDGEEEELGVEDDYQILDSTVRLDYGWSANFQLGADIMFRQLESADSGGSTSNTGIESLGFHFKYAFKGSPRYKSAVSLSYRFKLYSNEIYANQASVPSDEVILGDDGSEFHLRYHLDYIASRSTIFSGEIGYRIPPNDLSFEFPYRIALIKKFKKYAFTAGIEGIISGGADEYADDPTAKAIQATGSTNRWNSINREYMMPFGAINILMNNKYSLGFQLGQTLSGASTDGRTEALFSLRWNSSGVTNEDRFENSFKEYSAEASILKISPRGVFFKIDKGLSQDIVKGSRADIYKSDYFGGNVLIATGFIYESGPDWAIVKVVKRFKDVAIEKGFTVRVK